MNKAALLKWVESLPDNLQVLPVEISEVTENCSDWDYCDDRIGTIYPTVYMRTVDTRMTLRVNFTGQVSAEFKRDNFGNPQWANYKKV